MKKVKNKDCIKQTNSFMERLSWGTDAGFYRLLPQEVYHPKDNKEIIEILHKAKQENRHLTFRAAGTSLSGQAISDDMLVVVGKNWERYTIKDDGKRITMQPGIIGSRVNRLLAPYGYMFGPDPASLKSAMVGGVVMNNASGMSCGIHANALQLVEQMELILADGTYLNTADEASCQAFAEKHPEIISGLEQLRDEVRGNEELCRLIRRKYSIKNVMGLTLSPLLDFDNVFEMIPRLMVGSEGTLAFMSSVTMRNIPATPHQASALIYFEDTRTACLAVQALAKAGVEAAEMFDYRALMSVKDSVEEFDALPETATALLIRVSAEQTEQLPGVIAVIEAELENFETLRPYHFTTNPEEYNRYWAIRSGIFPSVGAQRPVGTSCLIEDVAFHLEQLPEATADLRALLEQWGYADAVIYGHALQGNYHFIINQRFDTAAELKRYDDLMQAVVALVVDKYGGSLKAEHGTGRNMAPFVEKEWGMQAYEVMKRIKALFDPEVRLNPGVIFNDDHESHLKNIKPLPRTHELIDRCIECGFCEVNCLSCGYTLSARQRIVVLRQISMWRSSGTRLKEALHLEQDFMKIGQSSCAADGLCGMACPVGINTGEMIHLVREVNITGKPFKRFIGTWSARNLSGIESTLKVTLNGVNLAHRVLGTKAISSIANGLYKMGSGLVPLWTPSLPKGARKAKKELLSLDKVVYFPSCINQTMGTAHKQGEQMPVMQKMVSLLEKAGYEVVFPEGMSNLCCGTIWESKGMNDEADEKSKELEAALRKASQDGLYPILCDQSPCLMRMRKKIQGLKLYEPAEFIVKYVADRLNFTPIEKCVTVHITCSMRKMGLGDEIIELARKCATQVMLPDEVGCCGFAGDKGFLQPELNQWALRKLRPQLEEHGVVEGYSNSRTCEIGLTTNSGITYQNIVYLVDQATESKYQIQGHQ